MLASLLAALVSGEALRAARQARRTAIAYLLIGLAVLAGVGFLIAAAYIAASDRYGSISTALAFAGAFFVLALLILLIHGIASRARSRSIASKRSSELAKIGAAATLAVLPTLLRGKSGLRHCSLQPSWRVRESSSI